MSGKINNDIIESFLRCDYKSYLKCNNTFGCKTEYELIESELRDKYKNKFYKNIRSYPENQILTVYDFRKKVHVEKPTFIISPIWQSKQFNIVFDALEILPNYSSPENITYIPITISPKENVKKLEKLNFVIKCLILENFGIIPEFGKIIYGRELKCSNIKLITHLQEAEKKLNELIKTINGPEAPRFYRNNFCKICEFQDACRTKLIELDDLSLLGGISKKEILKRNNRGIFSIYQLSYTFRPRKKNPKKKAIQKNQRFLWELKALSLREQRTYIQDVPKLPENKTEVYIDFEGLPEENFIYLIGILIKNNKTERCLSFWANSKEEEETIFTQFLDTLSELRDYTVYHYGSYEHRAIKRICKNFNELYTVIANRILKRSINVLNIFTSIVYPPTYTNELKEIASFLEFQWSEKNASGLQSIVWRKKWELYGENVYRHKLIQYNTDDCRALIIIKRWLAGIAKELKNQINNLFFRSENVIVEQDYALQYGRLNYVFPEFEYVNKCAYFDYQQKKIYFKTNDDVRKAIKRKKRASKH